MGVVKIESPERAAEFEFIYAKSLAQLNTVLEQSATFLKERGRAVLLGDRGTYKRLRRV